MCDYSLEEYRSRPAQEGETYQTYRFFSGSVGFVVPGDTQTAVCMACDMRLRLERIPESVQSANSVKAVENVIFTRLETGPYHDGVRFSNGAEITLQRLGPGVKAGVIDALMTTRREFETADVM